jgi:hypothetical protein
MVYRRMCRKLHWTTARPQIVQCVAHDIQLRKCDIWPHSRRILPHIYEKYQQAVLEPRFVRVSGLVQNQDGIAHLKAEHIEALKISAAQMASHDFH